MKRKEAILLLEEINKLNLNILKNIKIDITEHTEVLGLWGIVIW